jgi:murein L,D-transpeptidase YafK
MAIRPGLGGVLRAVALLSVALLVLAGCNYADLPKAERPVPSFLTVKMSQLAMKDTAPIFVRIFKEESQMEIWKQRDDGRYGLLTTYSICKWSGALGPKKTEGDRQAPEGFYTVTPGQMNPNSLYYLSFNIGYPNAYDRALGRTGSNLMVHGACSSAGCYSMTDEDAGVIFSLARDAFRGGQRAFDIQAFPFRLTAENLAKHRDDPNMDFWRMLKVGYDSFELTRVPPKVDVCDRHYVFNADAGDASFSPLAACPAFTVPQELADALQRKEAEDDAKFAQAVATIEQKQVDEAALAKAAAARAANPSFLQRMLGVQPQAVAPAPATPVPPSKVAASAVPAKKVTVPTPKAAPALASVTSKPAPAEPVLAPAATAAVAPAPPAAPASVTDTAATADDGKIAPGMTPEIQPVGKFVKKKFLWPGDDAGEDGSTQPSG